MPPPSITAPLRRLDFRDARGSASCHLDFRLKASVFTPFGVVARAQGAPIPAACKAISRFLASTRLASPNRLYNWTLFLAKPL